MTDMNVETPADGAHAGPSRLNASLIDAVEVSLEVFVGAARLTVAQLSTLGSGSVITLAAPLNSDVELRLNGVVIGRGELVAVGDNFAVRISELSR